VRCALCGRRHSQVFLFAAFNPVCRLLCILQRKFSFVCLPPLLNHLLTSCDMCRARAQGKSMIYSGDTFNDAAGIQQLYKDGYLSAGRRDALLQFPWHKHDVILHEAGVPPIHTPMSTFEALSPEIKVLHFPLLCFADCPLKSTAFVLCCVATAVHCALQSCAGGQGS
jgi:hypothetical protein